MTDQLSLFLDFMRENDSAPLYNNDIVADNKSHYYTLATDKPSQKRGSYCFKIDGDFAVGWVFNHRYGELHNYTSKSKAPVSPENKQAWLDKVEKEKLVRAAEDSKKRQAAAEKARKQWTSAVPATQHPYLERKKIRPEGLRVLGDKLLVPMYAEDKLWGLQSIDEAGVKMFMLNARKKGCFCPLASKEQDKAVILIAEGFATAASLREATKLPVICAFDAGNLYPVTENLKKKYPDSQFVFCADNDQKGQKKGQPYNHGLEAARQAAAKIGGAVVVFPEFEDVNLTDWNDAALLFGLNYVKNKILAVLPKKAPQNYGGEEPKAQKVLSLQDLPPTKLLKDNPPIDDNWRQHLLAGDKGIKSNSLHNAILYLKHHELFKGVFAYNEFHQNVMIVKCPEWQDPQKFEVERLSDAAVTQATSVLEKIGQTPDINRTFKAIQIAAEYNRFHPAREYFNNLVWDKKERLDTWLRDYFNCENESREYLSFVGKKWLTAGVTRIFQPGKKFDHVLVIEGEQGAFKSTSLKKLATFGTDKPVEYFSDSITIADIQNKDTIMKIQGSVIVELSELSGFSKKDDEEIKRWITLEHDNIRLPYGRETSNFKRQFILAATTNRYDYLKDPSGNRRYWPIKAGHRINIEAIERDKEQLWAEAVALYKKGLFLGPTAQEEELANIERQKRLAQDAWTDIVLDKARGHFDKFKISDIMEDMGMALRDKDDKASRRISSILLINGYENRSKWNSGTQKTERFWVKKDAPIQEEILFG